MVCGLFLTQLFQRVLNPIHSFLDILHGSGIREAHIVVIAESYPPYDGDLRLLEDKIGDVKRIADLLLSILFPE